MHDSGIICTDRQNYNAVDLTKFLCSILVVIIHVPPWAAHKGQMQLTIFSRIIWDGLRFPSSL